MSSPSIATILREHVSLSISCVDRLYLNGYVPLLQAPGQIATFCRQQLSAPIVSPALFRPLLERFMHDVNAFAEQHDVPIIHFTRDQKKDAVAAEQRARFTAEEGVVFIGIAQEKASSFKGHKDRTEHGVSFTFSRQPVFVNHQHRLTIWQLEVSLTQVFDAPLYGRQFFETLISDNLDLGRPQRVNLLFPTRMTRRTPPPRGGYHTRVITTGVAPSLHIAYKHTDIKQYFKEGRALRTETTINDAKDFQPTKALATLGHLRTIGQQINHRLLDAERLNHACSLQPSRFERLQQPIALDDRRVSALRFGDPRVHALLQAISGFTVIPEGFQNRDLRPIVATLLGRDLSTYSRGAMTYDLRRLRVHGLIQRVPRTNRYHVTLDGWQVAGFYNTLYHHVLRPGWAVLAHPSTSTTGPIAAALHHLADATRQLFQQLHPQPDHSSAAA